MLGKKNGDGARRPQDQQDAHSGSVVNVVYHIPRNGASLQRSELHEVGFPAKLVMSRWDGRGGKPVAFADTKVLWSDQDVERRFAVYEALEVAGAIPYTFMVVELARADQLVAELKADMLDEQDWREEQIHRQAVHVGVG